MATKLPRAKITDLATTVETEIFRSPAGPMVWGSVDISYASEGVEPRVTIRVPVPVVANQTEYQRRDEALRRARNLIDHACAAIELQADPSEGLPEIIEGVAEELGILAPTTKPRGSRSA